MEKLKPIGGIYTQVSSAFQRGVYEDNARCLKANTHDDGVVVEVKEATKQGYLICRGGRDSVNFTMPGSKTRRGRVGVDMANTLDTSCNQGIFVKISEDLTVYAVWYPKKQCYIAIRKLTPRECFRLQGWTDDYFERAEFVNSNSQLYKQAGNGVTVNVIKAIAEKF
jgi:DNA (cytosine-5)-methyltransferase 1